MVAVVGILLIVALIIAIEVPPLLRKKLKKELWVLSIILFIGTTLGITQALHIELPNPLDWMIFVYTPVYHMLEIWLK